MHSPVAHNWRRLQCTSQYIAIAITNNSNKQKITHPNPPHPSHFITSNHNSSPSSSLLTVSFATPSNPSPS